MKSTLTNRKESLTKQSNKNNQASIGNILQAYKKGAGATVQLWPDKPLWVSGPGKGFIPFMGAQFDSKYRNPKHAELLASIPEDQCPAKTFHQENEYASRYPFEGSKSVMGDAGIYAHKMYNKLPWPFK